MDRYNIALGKKIPKEVIDKLQREKIRAEAREEAKNRPPERTQPRRPRVTAEQLEEEAARFQNDVENVFGDTLIARRVRDEINSTPDIPDEVLRDMWNTPPDVSQYFNGR